MQLHTKHYFKTEHIKNLIQDDYYVNLIKLRNSIEIACDTYFQNLHAPKIDLFLISKGVSSPMGKGSDSLPIPFKFGKEFVYLVDSAQFGMEPLVQKGFELVYCYLPSFRGEDPDDQHLNQFYHCEAELRGDYKKCMQIVEGLVKYLIKNIIDGYKTNIFTFKTHNFNAIEHISSKQ